MSNADCHPSIVFRATGRRIPLRGVLLMQPLNGAFHLTPRGRGRRSGAEAGEGRDRWSPRDGRTALRGRWGLASAFLVFFAAVFGVRAEEGAELVVASLNPIATDLARQVGGEHVRIIALMPPGSNPHEFSPSPAALREAGDARLFLAMGKKLERYLSAIRDGLSEGQEVLELGRMIPSLKLRGKDALFACCPIHARGGIDPHWWHSIGNMRRAARILARAFAAADPAHADEYDQKRRQYDERLEKLEKWARRELARVPRTERRLTTPHAAFNYFCREYGFEPVFVKGLTTEEDVHSAHLAHVVETIREEGIRVVFPEAESNRAFIDAMVDEAGVRVGGELLAGAPSAKEPTYEAMMRSNIETIVKGLAERVAGD